MTSIGTEPVEIDTTNDFGKVEVESKNKIKYTIMRFVATEPDRMGIERTWFKWQCSCGDSQRYLNMDAMKDMSQYHADKHRNERSKIG